MKIPAVQGVALEAAEQLLLDIRIPALQPGDELLHLLAAAASVGGTGVLHHRQLQPPGHPADLLLPAVQQGADLGDAGAVQVRHRLEAADAPLEQQVHQQRLDGVVIVVAQGDFPDAQVRKGRVQAAPPQLGAQGAGVLLPPLLKHNIVHRHRDADVRHVQLFAVIRHRLKAHARHPRLQRDGLHLKRLGVEFPQPRQRRQRQQEVQHSQGQHCLPLRHQYRPFYQRNLQVPEFPL